MLVAFVNTDNVKRLLPYTTLPARDRICDLYSTRVGSQSVVDACAYQVAAVSRSTQFTLMNVIHAAAGEEDILLLGGLRLFRYAMPYVRRLYWYRSRIDSPDCPLWVQFDLRDWFVDRVTPGSSGVLTTLNRRDE